MPAGLAMTQVSGCARGRTGNRNEDSKLSDQTQAIAEDYPTGREMPEKSDRRRSQLE